MLTCAHNLAKLKSEKSFDGMAVYVRLPGRTPEGLLYIDEKDNSASRRITVDFVASAYNGEDPLIYMEEFLSIPENHQKDLALLRVRPDDRQYFRALDEDPNSLLTIQPADRLAQDKPIILSAINGTLYPTDDEIDAYSESCTPLSADFKIAVNELRPNFVTEFETVQPTAVNEINYPGCLGYAISTTPGSSGGLLSQDGKIVGMYRAIFQP